MGCPMLQLRAFPLLFRLGLLRLNQLATLPCEGQLWLRLMRLRQCRSDLLLWPEPP